MEKILVIDDEPFMQRLCEDMLSLRGFQVLTAGNAREGLAVLEKGGIDVVLLDIMMPDLSGIELLPIIKRTDPSIYVIMVTAYASLENAIEALKKGAYDYLRKPFRPHELYHAVDKALSRRRMELENKRFLSDLQLKVKELSALNRVGQYIQLIDRETNEMTIRAAIGLPEEVVKTTRQRVGQGIAGWVAEKGEPLLVNDIELGKSDRELELKVRELSALYEVSRVMGSTLNPEELAAQMLEQVGKLISWPPTLSGARSSGGAAWMTTPAPPGSPGTGGRCSSPRSALGSRSPSGGGPEGRRRCVPTLGCRFLRARG